MVKSKSIALLTALSLFWFDAEASLAGFTIDQEHQVRELSDSFAKKYGMKIKIKRESGKLTARIWDRGFYIKNWRITFGGADFVKKMSAALCDKEEHCEVLVKTHHSKSDKSRKEILKTSQYKMSSLSLQLLKSKISPRSLVQRSMANSEPLAKDTFGDEDKINDLNTRTEITFSLKRGAL